MRRHLTRSLERYRKLAADRKKPLEDPAYPFAGGDGELLRRAGAGRPRKAGEVKLHQGNDSLGRKDADRSRAGLRPHCLLPAIPRAGRVFERLPKLVAFLRCAIDIRNVDVAAASKAGVLVTQASAGFITSVTELVARLPRRPVARHHAIGAPLPPRQGAQGVDGPRAQGQHHRRHRLRRHRPRSGARVQGAGHAGSGARPYQKWSK